MSDATVPLPLPEYLKKSQEYYESRGIEYSDGYFTNSKGWRLKTHCWKPKSQASKGLIFACHGYGVDCSTYFCCHAEILAQNGYTVHGLDYQGFGQSEGLRGMFNSVDDIVDDLLAHYTPIRDAPEHAGLSKFLIGESMGGAVALKLHLREPEAWRGAVLLAPMCKVSAETRPSPLVEAVLRRLAWFFPTWAIVPLTDLSEASNENPAKRIEMKANPMVYKGSPRLGSAAAIIGVTDELEQKLSQISLPYLLLHGDADTVTDPNVSKALYEQSCSKDKTFKLYPGMWHSLVFGNFEDKAAIVCKDMVSWLDERKDG